MKPTNLDIKNLAAGIFILISSYAVPEINNSLEIKKYFFIFGIICLISTVFFKNKDPDKKTTQPLIFIGVDFIFFKSGLILVVSALLLAIISASEIIIASCIFFGTLSLIVSLFYERQEPKIFKNGDDLLYRRMIKLGYTLIGSALVAFFIYKAFDWAAAFILVYIIAFFVFILMTLLVIFFISRLLMMKY